MRLNLGLSDEQIERRKGTIGGSDANIILSGDDNRVTDLWQIKTGQSQPEDLSDVLPVQLGSYTEEFNRFWYEQQTGRTVYGEGREFMEGFRSCTLDGLTTTSQGHEAIFEAKHVNAFSKTEDVVQKYMPQLHHNMHVCGLEWAVLSIFKGTQEWDYYEVEKDPFYMIDLLASEDDFWAAVQRNEPPVHIPEPQKIEISKMREVDMTGSNEWSYHATDWLEAEPYVKQHKKADKAIKELIPSDACLAYGHGIEVKRAKNNRLTIKEATNE